MLTVTDIQRAYRAFRRDTQQVGSAFIVFGPAATIMRGTTVRADVIKARVLPSVIEHYKKLLPQTYVESVDGEPYISLPGYPLELYSNEGKSTQCERINGVWLYPLHVEGVIIKKVRIYK